ncbi:ABC transporter ATP-binding protein [Pseudoflavitalea sp. X16]|uniref:ATP-binding cassette domain-containing protein n=1 Tax=Paraflavitalea devenefica TaxID=2716334 RepID=UPI001423F8CB|nr:ABC transporter ATP-binding protein [Paraflavitalea devenefica]NII27271.1 ABC transporter ATP-binding protein [Paraflavitalea devenefica]
MKHIIKKSITILRPEERKQMGVLVVLDLLISLADIASLAWLLLIIKIYTQPEASATVTFLPHWLQNRQSLLPITLFLLLFSAKNLAGFLVYRRQCRFIAQVATRMARHRLLHYLEGAYTNYINVDSAVHIRNISYQPIDFCQHVLAGIQQVITQCVLILLTITAILIFNAQLFLLLFLLLLPPVVVVFYLVKKRLKQVRSDARSSSEKALQHLQEALHGFVESNIYNKNEAFLERYMTYQQQFNTHFANTLIAQGMPARMMEIFALLGLFILVALSQWWGNTGNTIITIGAFMAAAYKIIPGIVKILNISGQIQTYAYTADELIPESAPAPAQQPGEAVPTIQSLQFRDVQFSFGHKTILHNLNWSIQRGDFVGISGASGQGKTTVLNLLLGFLSPAAGQILINDTPLDSDERRQYWPVISYVKQQPFLTHDTILHNITLNGRHYQEEQFNQAITVAGLNNLLNETAHTSKVITENGRNISGGQRQRIAIARALYKNADLIILDEPFNELDADSENALLHHFKQLSAAGKMVILITHHKESLSFCNKIVSLHEEA